MRNRSAEAALNVERARDLRAVGTPYREIRRALGLSAAQLGYVRRMLKREKAARTRLRAMSPMATDRDLPISRSVLPPGLRRALVAAGYATLGDLADHLGEPGFRGLESVPGIGPHRARQIRALLDTLGLFADTGDLQAAVEALFPEFAAPND
jgi:hypothetical protein